MIAGLDNGTRTVAQAEHLLHQVVEALGLSSGVVGCTHFVRTGDLPHVACSLTLAGHLETSRLPEGVSVALGDSRTGPDAEGAAVAAAEHAARTGGRVVLFPGGDDLPGTLTVGELLDRTAIDRVVVLAQAEPPADDVVLVTNGHVRPVWRDGLMTLLAMPAPGPIPGRRIAPAEVPDPTPCCADHVS
ncbi:hypothetical protein [Microbispora sp. H10949]|uniref:hypothetical protein n=1 Tax=Microbispora sp. H10949 TaxID=2729111 RepID=UPI001603F927|nr:hypothetical protein [Microbispora sp. H10949]